MYDRWCIGEQAWYNSIVYLICLLLMLRARIVCIDMYVSPKASCIRVILSNRFRVCVYVYYSICMYLYAAASKSSICLCWWWSSSLPFVSRKSFVYTIFIRAYVLRVCVFIIYTSHIWMHLSSSSFAAREPNQHNPALAPPAPPAPTPTPPPPPPSHNH